MLMLDFGGGLLLGVTPEARDALLRFCRRIRAMGMEPESITPSGGGVRVGFTDEEGRPLCLHIHSDGCTFSTEGGE